MACEANHFENAKDLYNSDLFHVVLSKASKAISLLSSGSFSWYMFVVSTPVRGHARVDILGVGVGGWGGMLTFIATATTQYILLHFHTYVMLRCCTFSCTSTHTSCYAAARSPALPHIRHATSQNSLLC